MKTFEIGKPTAKRLKQRTNERKNTPLKKKKKKKKKTLK